MIPLLGLCWEWKLGEMEHEYKKYGSMQSGDPGSDISTAPVTLSSTGVLTPKTTISYEDGIQTIRVNVQITDGKSLLLSLKSFILM